MPGSAFRIAVATGSSPQRRRSSGRRAGRCRVGRPGGDVPRGWDGSRRARRPARPGRARRRRRVASMMRVNPAACAASRSARCPEGSLGRPTRGISTQMIGTPPSSAVLPPCPIDARQDLPMARLQGPLVMLGVPVRLDSRRDQDLPVQRRVETEASGQHVPEPPLIPAVVGLGRLADHQVGPHRPTDLAEVIPALAGRVARHGAVEDLDRRATRSFASARPSPARGSTRTAASTLTPQPTPIESPTNAMRKVPAGFSVA